MSEQYLEVTIDERIRTATALLAASDWPAMEQTITPHAVHPHSKQTMHYLEPYKSDAVVTELNAALGATGGMEGLFETAVSTNPHTAFATAANLPTFWASHADAWDEATTDLKAIFDGTPIVGAIATLTGVEISKPVILVPTIVYPLLAPVVVENTERIFIILPPAKAWGESRPWPFADDPGWAMAQVAFYLSQHLLRDESAQMDETDGLVRLHAIVVLCLEKEMNDAEAMAYLVRTKKEQKLPQLMGAVEAMREN